MNISVPLKISVENRFTMFLLESRNANLQDIAKTVLKREMEKKNILDNNQENLVLYNLS